MVFSITNHQENKSEQGYSILYPLEWLESKSENNCWQGFRKTEALIHAGGNRK
jgi:hypothetical protein